MQYKYENKIIRPGMIVKIVDDGWTYPTYADIPKHYGLENWKPNHHPKNNTKYKVLHFISKDSEFGKNGEKVLIEGLDLLQYQFIIGTQGVEVVEEPVEDLKLIEKNKAEKPQIFEVQTLDRPPISEAKMARRG
jgi:hypothetical protein